MRLNDTRGPKGALGTLHLIEQDLDQPPEANLVAWLEARLLAEWIIDLIEAGAVTL